MIVNAPKSKIDSKADFKKIMIKDGASFIDRGTDNSITVSDRNALKLVAGKQADGTKITINSKGADITVVGNGDIASVNVKGKSDITVRGKSDSAPKIVNNAVGASISIAMKTSVILNKAADLFVQAGAKIASLTVKAASDISVADGATVDAVNVSADKVNLKVDGTVAKVAVNAKADVAISGSTKSTIEVTNNAAGFNVQTFVKTDLKLNADAKVSLDKGAEGSSVKAEKEGVKPSVENKTSADVTIKDSTGTDSTIAAGKTDADAKPSTGGSTTGESTTGGSGSSSGGSTTPSTPSTPSVTKATLKLESDVTDRSYLKANDTLTAHVENAGSNKVTYQWRKNSAPIAGATSENYTIKPEDEGSRITVTVVVTASDGQWRSLTSEETDYIWEAVHVRFKNSITVEHGTTAADLKEFLNDKYKEVSLGTAADSEIVSGTVVWDVTDGYNGDIAGDYTATGTAPFWQTDWDSCFTIRFKHVTIFFMQLVFEVR